MLRNPCGFRAGVSLLTPMHSPLLHVWVTKRIYLFQGMGASVESRVGHKCFLSH